MTTPAPPRRPQRLTWPFRQWAVGDTDFYPQHTNQAAKAAWKAGDDRGWRFVTETRTEDGQRGVRIWRVA